MLKKINYSLSPGVCINSAGQGGILYVVPDGKVAEVTIVCGQGGSIQVNGVNFSVYSGVQPFKMKMAPNTSLGASYSSSGISFFIQESCGFYD
ncbi:hypothetical protein [Pseudoduganella violacea]|uniref:Uncharacterized protein n=1 Tax=Pseudoduganella violacea TaxID=1715466 RepID=A0A7W5B8R4_9BURK|nr:hypothetical protein [Pseudoduganella violacea]MBB3118621.1 hypothetical protein [Pseudoduganella violacea]